MIKFLRLSILFGMYFNCSVSSAETFDKCLVNFYKSKAPVVVSEKVRRLNFNLCFSNSAVLYSGLSKTGLYAAEFVSPESLQLAKKIKRVDNFHEEPRVPMVYRSMLSDFRSSGYDRGHLNASANRISIQDQYDSFSLVNIAPQSNYANAEDWRLVETAVRGFIKNTNQPAYIITGTLFLGKKLRVIGSGVMVPSHFYKVVVFPNSNVIGAYVQVNDNSGKIDTVSVSQLESYSGIKYFPSLTGSDVLNTRFKLPMNPNEASKKRHIQVDQQNYSNVFNMLPNPALSTNRPLKNPKSTQYKENLNEAKYLGGGVVSEVVEKGGILLKWAFE
ncbi:hypothetical protein AMD27_16690 (plasmid) [Acinetobacter sp. TGL-Y2]|uniref:DNA/RNA non-specific endonuclease n=1 Tax=Acinetobacter sp. TGL-Y2 TaxID=1407071 RepID=UPI0007A6492A|nr:DNA/RNA non-specific endonuclease [Acinetobacter sp. TGL-Y2]AMW80554.1 hypothetical protein AMD27_16690 [Acinetobacter sp. TGL-Y2]